MEEVYVALEAALGDSDYVCGELSIADMALFPQLSATKLLGVPFDADRHPKLRLVPPLSLLQSGIAAPRDRSRFPPCESLE